MCELMTLAAALFATAALFAARRAGRPSKALGTTVLSLWGAALMWSVDCIRSFREGDGLLDLSRGDAALGCLILVCAALLFAVLRAVERRRSSLPRRESV